MSTRVHELAKELGLKSQELLERIQKWGLDVKVSPLASLDPATVERIRELMKQSVGRQAQATPRRAAPRLGAPVRADREADRPAPWPPLARPAADPPPSRARRAAAVGRPDGAKPSCRAGRRRRRPAPVAAGRSAAGPAARRRRRPPGRRGRVRPAARRRGSGSRPVSAAPPTVPLSSPRWLAPAAARRLACRRRPALGPHAAPRHRRPARRPGLRPSATESRPPGPRRQPRPRRPQAAAGGSVSNP